MRFLQVTLAAPRDRLASVSDFYRRQLGLGSRNVDPGEVCLAVGETLLSFRAGPGEPFYHFALLVPGDRFAQALEWARARTSLLPARRSGEVVFDFEDWSAHACYFHDPGGNIVELIAHRGIGEASTRGEFEASELIGLSELGLVGDPAAMASALSSELGLELWDGTLTGPGRLAFVGQKARTLILSDAGRGWLPTGRPAEIHDVDVVISGSPAGEVTLERSRYRIARRRE
jgi:catechol 2,3-dioxygenase-like lactoylglutathione lyase family enzyme